ncbi:hypothetical protein V2I01_02875 [Micromonospora sp. BRA006-A]|nr:hypothetical protein [Micromonospora sp. BRA006-A]
MDASTVGASVDAATTTGSPAVPVHASITPPPAEPTTADTSVPVPTVRARSPSRTARWLPHPSGSALRRSALERCRRLAIENRQDDAAPESTADETTRETIADGTAQEPAAADGTGHSAPTPSTPEPVGTAADADATAAAPEQQAQAQAEDTEPTPAGTEHDAEHAGSADHTSSTDDTDDEDDAQDRRTPKPEPTTAPSRRRTSNLRRTPNRRLPDPEQALAAVGWELDPLTLRERAPDPAQLRVIRDGLTGKLDTTLDNRSRARLLSLRAVASRILGDLDDALGDARLAVTYAEATGVSADRAGPRAPGGGAAVAG